MHSQRAAEEKEIDAMDGDGGGDDQGGDKDSKGGDGDSDDDGTTTGSERTDGAEDDTTDVGKQTDGGSALAAKKRAIRKDRDPPMLGTKREDFTSVKERRTRGA
jgi:hypothetical protein